MYRRIRVVLIILIVVTVMIIVFEATRPYRHENAIDNYVDNLIGRDIWDDAEDFSPVYFEFPADFDLDRLDNLIPVTQERIAYIDSSMTLLIPSLDLTTPVRGGTSQAMLHTAPGLFASSGMPGEGGGNVSIAGHRSRGMFYYLDRLSHGDTVQLIYDSFIFTYSFYDRDVVVPTDWSVIADQGFDCVTLITCTPIGKADRRMIVRFIFESAEPVH